MSCHKLHQPLFDLRLRCIGLLLMSLTLLAFTACKTQKDGHSSLRLRGIDKEKAVAKHTASHLQFKVLTLKGKADYKNLGTNEALGFTYRIDIAKDSVILASVSKFGIPMMNMLLTQDSVFARILLDKSAIVCDYDIISDKIGMKMNFQALQNLLLGDVDFKEPLALNSGKSGSIELVGKQAPYSVSWFLNGSDFRLEKMVLKDIILGRESEVRYSDFLKIDGQSVATTLLLEATSPDQLRIDLHHSTIDFDKENVNFKFRIGESYEIKPCNVPQR
jgi:hypothetical protein